MSRFAVLFLCSEPTNVTAVFTNTNESSLSLLSAFVVLAAIAAVIVRCRETCIVSDDPPEVVAVSAVFCCCCTLMCRLVWWSLEHTRHLYFEGQNLSWVCVVPDRQLKQSCLCITTCLLASASGYLVHFTAGWSSWQNAHFLVFVCWPPLDWFVAVKNTPTELFDGVCPTLSTAISVFNAARSSSNVHSVPL